MFGISYWSIPLFAGCVWLGTLLAMLCRWIVIGSPVYPWDGKGQRIAYISDIGATSWGRPLFIAGSAVAVVSFDFAFVAERWLRHKGRLTHNYNLTEKVLSACATIAAIIGAAGLILLTIFDVAQYQRVHDTMLAVFIGGYIISAIFICAEYQRLGAHYREQRILALSFWIKLIFIVVEIGLVIAFGVLDYKKRYQPAAILEWTISAVYIFYIWSFIIDFLPATQSSHKARDLLPPLRRHGDDDEMAMRADARGNVLGGPVFTSGGGDEGSQGSGAPITGAYSAAPRDRPATGSRFS